MNLYHEVIAICWLAFFIVWAILAVIYQGGGRRAVPARAFGSRLFLLAAMFLGFFVSGRVQLHVSGTLAADLAAAGALLCIAGLLFAVWARVVLGRNWGMPMTLHADPELITSGPYRYVRHPIYTGLITMWIGSSMVYPQFTLPGGFIIVYTIFSAVREERDMEQRFPETYPEYRKRSKMILPFLI